MKLTTARLKKLIREELERMQEREDVYNLEKSGGDYEMKDGTGFDVDVYRDNSGAETLRVTVNGVKKLVGKVEDKEEIIRKLQSMDLKTAKNFGGPLFEEKK
jgi:hypothetical protein